MIKLTISNPGFSAEFEEVLSVGDLEKFLAWIADKYGERFPLTIVFNEGLPPVDITRVEELLSHIFASGPLPQVPTGK